MGIVNLPFELRFVIISYSKFVFPVDDDVMRKRYQWLIKKVIKNDNVEQLRLLIKCVKEPRLKHPKATYYAAYYGHAECLKLLIDADYPQHKLARHTAALKGHADCLKLMIDARYPRDPRELNQTIIYNNLSCVRLLLDYKDNEHEMLTDLMISSALIEASHSGRAEVIQWLLPLDTVRHESNTWVAVRKGHLDCLQILMAAGFKVHQYSVVLAATYGHIECLKFLLTLNLPKDSDASRIIKKYPQSEISKLLLAAGY